MKYLVMVQGWNFEDRYEFNDYNEAEQCWSELYDEYVENLGDPEISVGWWEITEDGWVDCTIDE